MAVDVWAVVAELDGVLSVAGWADEMELDEVELDVVLSVVCWVLPPPLDVVDSVHEELKVVVWLVVVPVTSGPDV